MGEMKEKIMVPVDFTKHTNILVDYAVHMAQALAAEVKFVHVVESFSGYDMLLVHPSFDLISADLKVKAQQLMESLIENNKIRLKDISGDVLVGDTVDTLLDYTEKGDFDLIIVGTHGTRGFEKVLMGSVASKLSQKSPCPILIVNPVRHLRDKKKHAGDK